MPWLRKLLQRLRRKKRRERKRKVRRVINLLRNMLRDLQRNMPRSQSWMNKPRKSHLNKELNCWKINLEDWKSHLRTRNPFKRIKNLLWWIRLRNQNHKLWERKRWSQKRTIIRNHRKINRSRKRGSWKAIMTFKCKKWNKAKNLSKIWS